ncbi:3938_t:CDS:2 [Paraglomus brasilianum]|uniref:3938_t:CDS:1 n=1 Tax=Paraglomus brasilianum TaxID=144538 RepID=A0A9N9FFI3_9GLOM|nr:3938_t:CDS:2 [Paraglomus brasilianum]
MNLPSFNIPNNIPQIQVQSSVNDSISHSDAYHQETISHDTNSRGKNGASVIFDDNLIVEENKESKCGKRFSWSGGKESFKKKFRRIGYNFRKFIRFAGPGYLIAVGYLDPGNWATDLSGGSQFGYSLLFIVFCSNLMAMLLQGLSVKLGIVTGLDLASACRMYFNKWTNYILYVLCELAIIACDLAEVIGSAIALNLLFKIPLPWGVAITATDVMFLLLFYRDDSLKAARLLETLVMFLVGTVGMCFILELAYSKPNSVDVLRGYLPSSGIFTDTEQLYVAIGIIGATVMPHNIYLHSHLVKVRKNKEHIDGFNAMIEKEDNGETPPTTAEVFKKVTYSTIKMSVLDSSVALTFALFVNSAILIVAAANFFYSDSQQEVADLFDAHRLLSRYLSPAAGILFALALLIAGQSSTLTATMAGQVVMEGFTGWRIRPWLRRLITRGLAIIPAMAIAIIKGPSGLNSLLVASQVALSIQLPFAVIPLVYFTAHPKVMRIDTENVRNKLLRDGNGTDNDRSDENNGRDNNMSGDNKDSVVDFRNPLWLTIIAGIISLIILGLDCYLVVTTIKDAIVGEESIE